METVFVVIIFLLATDIILTKFYKPSAVLYFYLHKVVSNFIVNTGLYKRYKELEKESEAK